MAIAAMIRMMATTIRSSISEKPARWSRAVSELCFFLNIFFLFTEDLSKKREEAYDFLPLFATQETFTATEENPTSRTGPLDLHRRQLLPS